MAGPGEQGFGAGGPGAGPSRCPGCRHVWLSESGSLKGFLPFRLGWKVLALPRPHRPHSGLRGLFLPVGCGSIEELQLFAASLPVDPRLSPSLELLRPGLLSVL